MAGERPERQHVSSLPPRGASQALARSPVDSGVATHRCPGGAGTRPVRHAQETELSAD